MSVWPRCVLAVMALLVLEGCASGAPSAFVKAKEAPLRAGVESPGGTSREDAMSEEEALDWEEDELGDEEEAAEAPSRWRGQGSEAGEADEVEEWGGGGVGWPDGVGDGRPRSVPLSLDYFQGFLFQAGVPEEALPVDGRGLSPEQALGLVPHLVSREVRLGDFAQKRMAAHLLLEVATGEGPVRREELHARMDRFHRLLVLRPDGYLVRPVTGEAVQKAGEVWLGEDGTPRAGRYEVGPFYAVEGGQLWPVDEGLEVPRGARPLGPYVPDDGVLLPALEGAGLALVDTVEGLYRLVLHPGETLEGLGRLPGAVRELVQNAPEYREAFRHKPYGEKVRDISRLTANVLLVVGTSGAGAVKAASWGSALSRASLVVPRFSLTARGELAVRLVAVAVPGRAVTVAGQALGVTHVLHMSTAGALAVSGWKPPVGGPGQWVPKNERMSERSRRFQHKVTGAPAGWVYRVWRNGEKADFDGFDAGFLRETKGLGYDKHFDAKLNPKGYFKGAKRLVRQAERQLKVANGVPIRWHVAEPRMVDILKRLFKESDITDIDVVYTPPLP